MPPPYPERVETGRYIAGLRARERAITSARAARAGTLRARLPALVECLVDHFRVRRVVLFGSLAGGQVHEHSDIDLAVEGLAPEEYWKALVQLSDLAGAGVDLVCLENAAPSLRRRVERHGEVLFG